MSTIFRNSINAFKIKSNVVSNSGEKDRPNYKPMYLENGAYELVQDGVIHSYEDIQSWKATCDMSTIIERYIRTGDSNIINQRAGFYADVTDLPKNYVELANMLANADNFFNALPADIKKEYEFNPAIFFAKADIDKVIATAFGNSDEPTVKVEPTGKVEPTVKVDPIDNAIDKGVTVNE